MRQYRPSQPGKRPGVAQLSDGLVALPADPRTREQLEWIAEDVTDHGGEAAVWLGRPVDPAAAVAIVSRMSAVIAAEYVAVVAEAAAVHNAGEAARRRVVARLRRELHRIAGRDFFPRRSAMPHVPRSRTWLPRPRQGCRHEVGHPRGHPRGPGRMRLAHPPLCRPVRGVRLSR